MEEEKPDMGKVVDNFVEFLKDVYSEEHGTNLGKIGCYLIDAQDRVKGLPIKLSQKDITNFCITELPKLEEMVENVTITQVFNINKDKEVEKSLKNNMKNVFYDRAAFYLSALAQEATKPKEEIVLDISKLRKPLDFMAASLENFNLKIIGDVGKMACYGTRGCDIEIDGNAGEVLGYFSWNSRIKVRGNVGRDAGGYAHSCNIEIGKDAGMFLGGDAQGCTINVKGYADNWIGSGAGDCVIKVKGLKGYDKSIKIPDTTKVYIDGKLVRKKWYNLKELFREFSNN